MVRTALFAVISICISSVATAQDVAAVDPAAAGPTVPGVVADCSASTNADGGVTVVDGCKMSTAAFLDAVRATDPAGLDQSVTDVVLAIVPLAQDDNCDAFDDEIAKAVRLAGTNGSSPEFIGQIDSIGIAVAACDVETGAIGLDNDAASSA
jgi:hypothetical protein